MSVIHSEAATELTQVIELVDDQPQPEYLGGKHALDVVPERFDPAASITVLDQMARKMGRRWSR